MKSLLLLCCFLSAASLCISLYSVNSQVLDKLHVFDLKTKTFSSYGDYTLANTGRPKSVFSFGYSNIIFFESTVAIFGDNSKKQLIFDQNPSTSIPALYPSTIDSSEISCGETFCIRISDNAVTMHGNFSGLSSVGSTVLVFPDVTEYLDLQAGSDHVSFFNFRTVYTFSATGWSSQTVSFNIKEMHSCGDYNVLRSTSDDLHLQIIKNHWGYAANTIVLVQKKIIFQTLSCGWNAVFLFNEGNVSVFGLNEFGEFGNGERSSEVTLNPQIVPIEEELLDIDYSKDIVAALTVTGKVYIWGANNPIFPNSLTPQLLTGVNNITFITVGICHLVMLDEQGFVWTIGCNEEYACASTEIILTEPKLLYFQYMIPSSIVMVSKATDFLTYISNKGELYARGNANKNQIGFSNTGSISAATPVPFYSYMYIRKSISAGTMSIAISSYSNLYLMGSNSKLRYGNVLTNENVRVGELRNNILDTCIGNTFIGMLSLNQSLYILGGFNSSRFATPTWLDNEVESISCLASSQILAYRKKNRVIILEDSFSYSIDAEYYAVMKEKVVFSKSNQLFSISKNQTICKYFEFKSSIKQLIASNFVFAAETDSGIVYTASLLNCTRPTLLNFTIPLYNTSQWDVLMSSYDDSDTAPRRITISQVPICFGKHMFPTQAQSIDKYPCGGISRGQCIAYNQCQCQQGYVGAECNEFACYGKAHMDQNVCNGNGMCNEPNNCLCLPGYYGLDCAIATCFMHLANETSKVCSGNGKCADRNLCICNWLYMGKECDDKTTMTWTLIFVLVILPCFILCASIICIVPLVMTLITRSIQKKYKSDKTLMEELQQDENIEDDEYSILRQEIEHAPNITLQKNSVANGIHEFQLGCKFYAAKKAKADEYTHGMKFRHQNLLPWLALREIEGEKYVINQRMTGTLDDYSDDVSEIESKNPELVKRNNYRIALQSCFGLAVLHYKHKLVHRDIKNQNILLDYDKYSLEVKLVKIFDFDACKKVDDEDWNECDHKFTAEFAAPEIHTRNISKPYLIDIYSLGVVFRTLFGENDALCIKMTNASPEKRPKNILKVIKELVRRIQQENLSSALASDVSYASVICKTFETKGKSARTMSKTKQDSVELQTLKQPFLENMN